MTVRPLRPDNERSSTLLIESLPVTGNSSLIGKGYFAILIDQGAGTKPYQGITPIAGASLAECAQTYFAQSEQLPTRFSLKFGQSILPGEKETRSITERSRDGVPVPDSTWQELADVAAEFGVAIPAV